MTDFAHIKFDSGKWETQSIADHCRGTAEAAGKMAESFGAGSWAYICGLWHDIGKYSTEFQQHIIAASGYNPQMKDSGKVDHATAGALLAKELLKNSCWPVAYCICGHHRGLMDYTGDGRNNLQFHLSSQEQHLLEDIRKYVVDTIGTAHLDQLPQPHFDNNTRTPKAWHLWIRMLFSCLVDADWLDTERFMSPEAYSSRSHYTSLSQLKAILDNYLYQMSKGILPTPVNAIRAEVQELCRQAAAEPQGIYSLTVPTGGGKTLSSAVWAMGHAMKHDLKRIIIAIPYTSIVTQTADSLRKIFGTENVVEHHSYVDFDNLPDNIRHSMKLATENWDAPIIVTTNVQLFESLYSNKPSRCRKLHNLAKSVLILDEVQSLPGENLHPIIDILDSLSKYMGTSILFTTATQPAFSGTIGSGQAKFEGLRSKEIIPYPDSLFDKMRRVNITIKDNLFTIESLAASLDAYPQVLCVVNTRREAQQVYDALPNKDNAVHLSRMMCQQHISDKLDIIKQRLNDGKPVQVISTQLIEAGVDIDFPVVWREMAGLDSIAQSAGRCNREGKLKHGIGEVYVFKIEDSRLRGVMGKAVEATRDLIEIDGSDFLSPRTAKQYFHLFYSKLNSTDKSDVTDLLYRTCPQFEKAADSFNMIDDNTLTVYVPYASGEGLIERLKRGDFSSELMRRLQRFSINVPPSKGRDLVQLGAIRLGDYVYMLPDCSNYDKNMGLTFSNKWLDNDLII